MMEVELRLVSLLAIFQFAFGAAITRTILPDTHFLSWEEYWVETAQSHSVRVTIDASLTLNNYSSGPNPAIHNLFRQKRIIYGKDERVRVDPSGRRGQKFPYTTQMKVSTGCSGVMVSKHHVLTAAHCVHDGTQYLPSALYFLMAGYLKSDGSTKWHFVRRFFVPGQWKNLTSSNQHMYSDWDDYDVAVLELVDDIGDERDVISPGLSGLFCNNKKSLHGTGTKVEFISFPDDKSDQAMWYHQIDVITESRNLIYFHGAAWHGSSGAGMLVWDYDETSGTYEKRVVGVLSGNRETESLAKIQGEFNVGARLGPVNFALVCHWIGTWDACHQRYKEYLDSSRQSDFCV